MRQYTKILLLLMFSSFGWTQKTGIPSCQPVTVRGETVLLTTKKPVLILIHNSSSSDLWVTHSSEDIGASAGWSSHLSPGLWSALLLDKKTFTLTCVESNPGHEQQIPCEGMLVVCAWNSVTITAREPGTYWAAENRKWLDLLGYLGGRGFSLPALDNQ